MTKRIAIVGGGPSALFIYKRLVDANENTVVDIFERGNLLGAGMPYSKAGAGDEHITNVSGNEIPEMVTSVEQWIKNAPKEILDRYGISLENFNEYKVFPRLLFGSYLTSQFELLLAKARVNGLKTRLHLNADVTDISDNAGDDEVNVIVSDGTHHTFDSVIICTGHNWPLVHEGSVPNYFDSPYPPAKLAMQINYPVAIRGSSLTAIDAMRTLCRHNGSFAERKDGMLDYHLAENSEGFSLVMYSKNGMLPAVRFHLEDSHLGEDSILSEEEIRQNISANDGFLSLDYVFEKNFKEPFSASDPEMYARIKDMRIEEFVAEMMALRTTVDPFALLKAEYAEAEKSIRRKESVHWKEMLAILSFAMNYPAKHFSAEDMLRLQNVLMPLISIVIAFVPQSSCKELIALYNAGLLKLVTVDDESKVEPREAGGATMHFTDEKGMRQSIPHQLFVDSIGQPHLSYDQFPFKSLLNDRTISRALLKFRSQKEGEAYSKKNKNVQQSDTGDYYLQVPGISINDYFQVLDRYGALNPRIYIMAVPYIAGFNPDYSGLDFCEAASERIAKQLLATKSNNGL